MRKEASTVKILRSNENFRKERWKLKKVGHTRIFTEREMKRKPRFTNPLVWPTFTSPPSSTRKKDSPPTIFSQSFLIQCFGIYLSGLILLLLLLPASWSFRIGNNASSQRQPPNFPCGWSQPVLLQGHWQSQWGWSCHWYHPHCRGHRRWVEDRRRFESFFLLLLFIC